MLDRAFCKSAGFDQFNDISVSIRTALLVVEAQPSEAGWLELRITARWSKREPLFPDGIRASQESYLFSAQLLRKLGGESRRLSFSLVK